MRLLASALLSVAAVVLPSPDAMQGLPADIDRFLRTTAKFADADLASLAAGRVITRIDRGSTDTEVAVIAAVKVLSPRTRTAQSYGQFLAYVDGQVTLGFGRFSRPPALADVKDLALDRNEIAALRSCRPVTAISGCRARRSRRCGPRSTGRPPTSTRR